MSDPTFCDSEALLVAVKNGHVDCVKELLPFSYPNADNGAILGNAVSGRHMGLVQILLPFSNPDHYGRALVHALWGVRWSEDDAPEMIGLYNAMVDLFCTPENCSKALDWANTRKHLWKDNPLEAKSPLCNIIEQRLMQYKQQQVLLDIVAAKGINVQRKM